MPAYDYRCKQCGTAFTKRYESIAAMDADTVVCPNCASTEIGQIIRRVAITTSEERRLERIADPARLANLDENDPTALGRTMRELASAMDEDPGPEFDEVTRRLESGESPDSIEESFTEGDP
ncbi:MAG: zinc ribbon domain-containing protein [Anaerolineae bacterium]